MSGENIGKIRLQWSVNMGKGIPGAHPKEAAPAYLLVLWVLDASHSLQGKFQDNRCYGWVLAALRSAVNAPELAAAAQQMEQKVLVFTRLRKAMRNTLPENKQGLTDCGEHEHHTLDSHLLLYCIVQAESKAPIP